MANAQKYTASQAGGMTRHYERYQKENGEYQTFGNQDIDTSRIHLNYNLAPKREGGQLGFIKQRASEVKCLKRDDVNVMCSWVITAPEGLATGIEQRAGQRPLLRFEGKEVERDLKLFFEESYRFLNERYAHGSDRNVISAYVHMDETTPHMHYAFVPVVVDRKKGHEKVSASEAINRYDLKKFHPDLDRYMTAVFGRDIGIINQATKDGNKSVDELKQETKIAQSEIKPYRELKANIDDVGKKARAIKIPFTNKVIAFEKTTDRQNTEEQAKGYIANRDEIKDIRARASRVTEREVVADGREHELNERAKTIKAKEKQLDGEIKAVYAALNQEPGSRKSVDFGYSSANYIYAIRNTVAEKESEVKDMYHTQKDLNKLYELEMSQNQERFLEIIALNNELKEVKKEISLLRGQNDVLRNDLVQVGVRHQNEIETASSALKAQLAAVKNDMSNIIANMAMAIGSTKYGNDKYKISHLSEPEGRFIDAISNYAEGWLDKFGLHELSEKVRTKVFVSQGIESHVKALEPKLPQINRGISR